MQPLSIALGLALLLAGCSHPAEPQAELQEKKAAVAGWSSDVAEAGATSAMPDIDPGDESYVLDSGDRLRIFVYGQPNLSRVYPVDQGGFITVPLIGAVRARGLTSSGLERQIRNRLATHYVRDPQVTVDIAQNRPFFILGEVRNAGQYPHAGGLTVRSAVAIAGGFTERANETTVHITRRRGGLSQRRDVPSDTPVEPGDTIYVYERYF